MKHDDDPAVVDVSRIRLHGGPFEGRTMQSSWLPKTFAVDGARYEFRGYEARYEFVSGARGHDSDARADDAREEARSALQAWAERYEELAPAARAGYDVGREVVEEIRSELSAQLREAGLEVVEDGASADGERRAPRPDALEKRERALSVLRDLSELAPPCVSTDVGRIVRLVLDGDDSAGERRTGFVVSVSCPALDLTSPIAIVTE